MLAIGPDVCRDFARSSRLEWLVTDGAGGFAMGTVAGVNTRRYHGLLVAALHPPADRHLLLARLDETVEGVALATCQYPGAVSPQGYLRLVGFRLDPSPVWVYEVAGARVEKRLSMSAGTVVVQYRSSRAVRLEIAPFIAFRDSHALTSRNSALDGTVRVEGTDLHARPYASLPELTLRASPGARFTAGGEWYLNHEYLRELERGLDFREDLWKLGSLTLDLEPDRPAFVSASISGRFEAPSEKPSSLLERAADQFLVRGERPTVIAGYPWFTDWGRDTMISLPGLLLARGRLEEAREILRGFLAHLDRGLIPNRFPDSSSGKPEYNTVDATLWMFQAVHALGDARFVKDEFYPAAKEIVRWHQQGTRHGIVVDPRDRLLAAGEPGVALTWMDARFEGRVFTARHGKPVEINALWYNALRLMAQWGRRLGDEPAASEYAVGAEMVSGSFAHKFWNPRRGCLFDVVGPDDPSLRPNQLFAVSLPFPLLSDERRKSVVRVVERELLTPYGLRTLAPGEPGYAPHYRGGREERDAAYHQGTVWPWLLGPYVRAYLAAFGRNPETLRHCRDLLAPLQEHLESQACLGSISEVFDAEPPFAPAGAPAQAWSVAELIQLLSVELAQAAAPR